MGRSHGRRFALWVMALGLLGAATAGVALGALGNEALPAGGEPGRRVDPEVDESPEARYAAREALQKLERGGDWIG